MNEKTAFGFIINSFIRKEDKVDEVELCMCTWGNQLKATVRIL